MVPSRSAGHGADLVPEDVKRSAEPLVADGFGRRYKLVSDFNPWPSRNQTSMNCLPGPDECVPYAIGVTRSKSTT